MPLVPQVTLQAFDKWDIDFVGPINPIGKRIGARYIINANDYLTRWAQAIPIRDCTFLITSNFLFDNVVT